MTTKEDILFGEFATAVTKKFSSSIKGQPEDQLRSPMEKLVTEVGKNLGFSVLMKGESKVADGRPDFGVGVGGLLTGYFELKAPGKGARPEHYSGADREQWQKFKALPNIIYSDGNEWSLYNTGQLARRFRIVGDVTGDGASAVGSGDGGELCGMLLAFLSWQPIVPGTASELAQVLAPLCRLLRSDVTSALGESTSSLSQLKTDWQTYLFPDCDDAQFADAYAQTVTYALLLAHSEGLTKVEVEGAVKTLKGGHALLSRVLQILGDDAARAEIGIGIELLERAISAVDVPAISKKGSDPWLYFYEDFLAAYDPELRKGRGVYYTPVPVVRTQVKLVTELLESRFGKQWGFADNGVVTLDPATGTGTYPLLAIEYGLRSVRDGLGEGAVPSYATALANSMNAFEILVGPYAVAHLRLTERLTALGGAIPSDGVHMSF